MKKRDRLPTHVPLSERYGLTEGSFAMMEQIFTIDKSRLDERVGAIHDEDTLGSIEKAIVVSLELR